MVSAHHEKYASGIQAALWKAPWAALAQEVLNQDGSYPCHQQFGCGTD
jgi:hypothetical protein